MDLQAMYQEIILDNYKRPSHKGLQEPFEIEVHHVNPTCGDEITLRLSLADGQIVGLSWDGLGCSISQASTSVMTTLVDAKSLLEVEEIGDEFLRLMQGRGAVIPNEELLEDGVAFSGVAKYPARVKCALLGWMALKDAIVQLTERNGNPESTNRIVPDRSQNEH
ncbi:MAG TPA: SUF system NifU family Fe-S cluster assembly protein [Candidatus Nanopelagicaceae bacterium]|nr:SUF system NifU family Fe-S cluster assembly protein [Candidatus Nanopelagicaceae bacterium]